MEVPGQTEPSQACSSTEAIQSFPFPTVLFQSASASVAVAAAWPLFCVYPVPGISPSRTFSKTTLPNCSGRARNEQQMQVRIPFVNQTAGFFWLFQSYGALLPIQQHFDSSVTVLLLALCLINASPSLPSLSAGGAEAAVGKHPRMEGGNRSAVAPKSLIPAGPSAQPGMVPAGQGVVGGGRGMDPQLSFDLATAFDYGAIGLGSSGAAAAGGSLSGGEGSGGDTSGGHHGGAGLKAGHKNMRQQEANKAAQQRYREKKKQKFHEMEHQISLLKEQLVSLQAVVHRNKILEVLPDGDLVWGKGR